MAENEFLINFLKPNVIGAHEKSSIVGIKCFSKLNVTGAIVQPVKLVQNEFSIFFKAQCSWNVR